MKTFNIRYFIGELIIVTAGVLIAFQLSQVKESRQDHELTKTYLESLHADLLEDSTDIYTSIQQIAEFQTYLQGIIPHFFRELPGRDTVVQSMFKHTQFIHFIARDATYNTMESTGSLALLDDASLKIAITRHYDSYQSLYDENERIENFSRSYYATYMMEHVDQMELFMYGKPCCFDDTRFRNLVFSMTGILQIQEKTYREALERCRDLISKLEV